MADLIEFEVVTPERRVLAEEVTELVLPGAEGYLGVRPGHAPLLARLHVGEVKYVVGGKESVIAISGGYAEVLRHRVSVLAETAERPGEIDEDRAQSALRRAEERLKQLDEETDIVRAQVSLARAMNRLSISQRQG